MGFLLPPFESGDKILDNSASSSSVSVSDPLRWSRLLSDSSVLSVRVALVAVSVVVFLSMDSWVILMLKI